MCKFCPLSMYIFTKLTTVMISVWPILQQWMWVLEYLASVVDLGRLRTTILRALILTFVAYCPSCNLVFLRYSCYYPTITNLLSMCLFSLHCFFQSQNYNCVQQQNFLVSLCLHFEKQCNQIFPSHWHTRLSAAIFHRYKIYEQNENS